MTTTERKDLTPDLIGKVVEVGVYNKSDDEWVITIGGTLVNYSTSPERGVVTITDSGTKSTEVFWDQTQHYILITLYTEGI